MDNQYKKLNTEHATSGISMQIIPTSQLYQKIDNSQIYDGNTALRQNNVAFPPKKPKQTKNNKHDLFCQDSDTSQYCNCIKSEESTYLTVIWI